MNVATNGASGANGAGTHHVMSEGTKRDGAALFAPLKNEPPGAVVPAPVVSAPPTTTTTGSSAGSTSMSPATPINWTPWILGAIAAVTVGVGGFFLYRYLSEGGSVAGFKLRSRKNPVRGLKSSTKVQTIIFKKSDFTAASAKKWAREHGFKAGKVDETSESFRLRQRDPGQFQKDSFRTISFRRGVSAVVARPR